MNCLLIKRYLQKIKVQSNISIALISQLSSRSLSFSWQVSLVRVKVESFVNWLVLAGMLILLNIRNYKPKNFEMVQVKPNWHDSSELIGYVSQINGERFVVGPFLRFMVKAIHDPKHPYFLCLDEMNLAPVEQYFAEFLSVIESRTVDEDGVVVTDPIVDYEQTEAYKNLIDELFADDDEERNLYLKEEGGKRLTIPQNLIIVGTVNMDETTFSFSRKVLDRAMTIEMNEVDLYGGLTSRHEQIGKLNFEDLVGDMVEGVDVYQENLEVCNQAILYLQEINAVLEGTVF